MCYLLILLAPKNPAVLRDLRGRGWLGFEACGSGAESKESVAISDEVEMTKSRRMRKKHSAIAETSSTVNAGGINTYSGAFDFMMGSDMARTMVLAEIEVERIVRGEKVLMVF